MAIRPIFIPFVTEHAGAEERDINFKWHPGMAKSQKQKSISELHYAAKELGINNILEISSKSEALLGINLSAFNLVITTIKNKNKFTVETAFQGSKVFSLGGPYLDLFGMDSLAAKKDPRLKNSGALIKFEFFGKQFPLEPKTYFYDWLYINALMQNKDLAADLLNYDAFSDIEFNPEKSINCQAHSAALYVSLARQNLLDTAMSSPDKFLSLLNKHYSVQLRKFKKQEVLF
jgi:hypothetical protein